MTKAGTPGRGAILGLALIAVAGFPASSRGAEEQQWPTQVAAVYRLSFNGFEVGKYNFVSRYDGKTYAVTSGANISALFGAFKWTGTLLGGGTVLGHQPRPASYKMSYKTKSKLVSVALGFDNGAVNKIALVPVKPLSPEVIKVKPEQLRNVFDPMGATLAISNANPGDACNRTIPIFDGKARFDLKLSPKGREPVKERTASGQPAELMVCRVKYVPISGHKPKDFENPWIDYDNIEIALRAIPSAGIYVPYRLRIPTTIGPAEMTAYAVNITLADNVQIALKQ